MKKTILIATSIFIFLLSNPVFSQIDPGSDPDAPPMPINNYVWVLAVVGMLLVFLKLRAIYKQEISSQE